ncbi:MAG: hypothetical protein ACN6OR_09320, partial [Stenotrophomonas sp.]
MLLPWLLPLLLSWLVLLLLPFLLLFKLVIPAKAGIAPALAPVFAVLWFLFRTEESKPEPKAIP